MADTITLAIDALASAAFIEGGVSIERTNEAREYTEQRKRELIEAIAACSPQAVAAQAPTGNWINADDVSRLVRDLDIALHGEYGAASQAALCDVVGLVKEAARKLGRPVLAAQAAPAAVAVPASWADIEDDRPTSRADLERLMDEWNDTTGALPRDSGWRAEVLGMLHDAYDLGAHQAPPAIPATEDSSAGDLAEPTDAEIVALNEGERFFSMSESRFGKEVNPHTQYHTGEPGYLQFARAVLARWGSAPQAQPTDALDWAVQRWNDEVRNRPMVNIHRRSLDDTWRQVITYLGGDADKLVGPSHDDLLAAAQEGGNAATGKDGAA